MPDRFDKFSERARRVLNLAQQEAIRLNHRYIGVGHLLLGLLMEGEGVAAKVLTNLGVGLESARAAVQAAIERSARTTGAEVGLTREAKRVIELGVDEARKLNHGYIGTEHLLVGLTREETGSRLLVSLGVDAERVRAETTRILPPHAASVRSSGMQGFRVSSGGGDRFDKFSDRARRVLTLAQEEAQRFSHNYIGTEHLLLGLITEGEGVAAKVLANLGVKLDAVRSGIEFIIGRGDRAVLGEIGLTPRAKKVIELAVDEARQLNHGYIGTEHILLGLVREGEGIAAGVLESLGVNLERIRAETTRVLAHNQPQGAGVPAQPEPVYSPPPGPVSPLGGLRSALRLVRHARAEALARQNSELANELLEIEQRLGEIIKKHYIEG